MIASRTNLDVNVEINERFLVLTHELVYDSLISVFIMWYRTWLCLALTWYLRRPQWWRWWKTPNDGWNLLEYCRLSRWQSSRDVHPAQNSLCARCTECTSLKWLKQLTIEISYSQTFVSQLKLYFWFGFHLTIHWHHGMLTWTSKVEVDFWFRAP